MSNFGNSGPWQQPTGFSKHRRSNSISLSSPLILQPQEIQGSAQVFQPPAPVPLRLRSKLLPPVVEEDEPGSATSSNYDNLPNTVFIPPVTPSNESHGTTPVLDQLSQFSVSKDSPNGARNNKVKTILDSKFRIVKSSPKESLKHLSRIGTKFSLFAGSVDQQNFQLGGMTPSNISSMNELEEGEILECGTQQTRNIFPATGSHHNAFSVNDNGMPLIGTPMNMSAKRYPEYPPPTAIKTQQMPYKPDSNWGFRNNSPFERRTPSIANPNFIPIGRSFNNDNPNCIPIGNSQRSEKPSFMPLHDGNPNFLPIGNSQSNKNPIFMPFGNSQSNENSNSISIRRNRLDQHEMDQSPWNQQVYAEGHGRNENDLPLHATRTSANDKPYAQIDYASSGGSSANQNISTNTTSQDRGQSTMSAISSLAQDQELPVKPHPDAKALAELIRHGGVLSDNHDANVLGGPVLDTQFQKVFSDPFLQNIQTFQATGKQFREYSPFIDLTQQRSAGQYGVLKFRRIPWDVKTEEIVQLIRPDLVRKMRSMPTGSNTSAVHIMMDRISAKTLDCYAEFMDTLSAKSALQDLRSKGRNIRGFHIGFELSDQTALMTAMFPRALDHIKFQGVEPMPTVQSEYPKGFLHSEELVGMNKVLTRSHDLERAPTRTFEAMISLLFKYPWTYRNLYPLKERNLIFETCRKQIKDLIEYLHGTTPFEGLSQNLLDKLVEAGLKCDGFSEKQRAALIDAAQPEAKLTVYVSPLAKVWPFSVIRCKTGATEEKIWFFGKDMKKDFEKGFICRTVVQKKRWLELPFGCEEFINEELSGDLAMETVANMENDIVEKLVTLYLEEQAKHRK